MYGQKLTRRELFGLGLGAAAGALLRPRLLSASENPWLTPLSGATPPTDIDAAAQAAAWIQHSRVTTKNGIAWPVDPKQPGVIKYDLASGSAGIVIFLLEMFRATGDQKWLDEAKLGANELMAQTQAFIDAQQFGLYTGLSGAGFALEEVHRSTNDPKYRDAAMEVVTQLHSHAKRTTLGAVWPGPSATNDILSGASGIGLFLLWVDQNIGHGPSRTLALAAGRHLLDLGIEQDGGMKWAVSGGSDENRGGGGGVVAVAPGAPATFYPNFAEGTAGVAYFLATLLKTTGDRSFMAAALSGAHYLEVAADTSNGGYQLFHHEGGGEKEYDLGWCNGPAGTSRLFHRMGQITQRPKWDVLVKQCAQAILNSGAPEHPAPQYWMNASQCDGTAGIGDYFIDLQGRLPSPQYAAFIDRLRADALRRASAADGGLCWVEPDNREAPNTKRAQTGYLYGAAGIGAFFVHLDGMSKNRQPQVQWPDSPVFEPCFASKVSSTSDMSALVGQAAPGVSCTSTSPR
jgi:hypothetical protein